MEIWKEIIKNFPIWYLDASGNVFKEIEGQAAPLLYSIVCHDNVSTDQILQTKKLNMIKSI